MSNTPQRAGMPPIVARAALTAILGMTLACSHSSPTTPTAPASMPVASGPLITADVYTLSAGADHVAPEGQLSVSWTASIGGFHDSIALFKKGEPNTTLSRWSKFTGGKKAGTFALTAPAEAGEYEFRYMFESSFFDVARSSLITVGP